MSKANTLLPDLTGSDAAAMWAALEGIRKAARGQGSKNSFVSPLLKKADLVKLRQKYKEVKNKRRDDGITYMDVQNAFYTGAMARDADYAMMGRLATRIAALNERTMACSARAQVLTAIEEADKNS